MVNGMGEEGPSIIKNNEININEHAQVNAAYKMKKSYKSYKSSKVSKYTKKYSKYTKKYSTYTKKYSRYSRYSKYRKVSAGYVYSVIGDCWAMSNYLFGKLSGSAKVRIVQYRTSMSSAHRSIQFYINGRWTDYNYRGNGYNRIYSATSSKPGLTVVRSN